MINLTNLNSTMVNFTSGDDRRACFNITLNTIQVYDGNPDDSTTAWIPFQNPIIDEVQFDKNLIPQVVNNNVTIIYNTTANRNVINLGASEDFNWRAPEIFITFVFNLVPTNQPGCGDFQGSQFLNNTVLNPFRVTSPFLYDYNQTNVTQPQLRDAVLDVAVWAGAVLT